MDGELKALMSKIVGLLEGIDEKLGAIANDASWIQAHTSNIETHAMGIELNTMGIETNTSNL